MRKRLLLLAGSLATLAVPAAAQTFNGGIPVGFTCLGACGTSPADGAITLAPGGGTRFGYVTTNGGVVDPGTQLPNIPGQSGDPNGSTNGSSLTTSPVAVAAGTELRFLFNYVTSDGAGYADYAFVRLLGGAGGPLTLFTARTTPSGNTVPGFGLPPIAPGVTLTPSTVVVTGPADPLSDPGPHPQTTFSPLGVSSGTCYDVGCGLTGWVLSQYVIPAAGTYQLQFGVANLDDEAFDSALAFDGLQLIQQTPTTVPEPATLALVGGGLLALGTFARRRVG